MKVRTHATLALLSLLSQVSLADIRQENSEKYIKVNLGEDHKSISFQFCAPAPEGSQPDDCRYLGNKTSYETRSIHSAKEWDDAKLAGLAVFDLAGIGGAAVAGFYAGGIVGILSGATYFMTGAHIGIVLAPAIISSIEFSSVEGPLNLVEKFRTIRVLSDHTLLDQDVDVKDIEKTANLLDSALRGID